MGFYVCNILIIYCVIYTVYNSTCTACSPGRYGKDCKHRCGHCERKESCNYINGSCPGSCESGYYGERCLTKQLVRPGYTRAHSSSIDYGGYPNKTVDGDFRQRSYRYCMHTASGETEAWLMIDLGRIYNIHSVKFWYRNDSNVPGYNTRRIQGFNIRLSNTNQTSQLDVCYQDDEREILPPITEKECEGEAQYVWIYTNKMFRDGAMMEVCEVQVFGCSYQDSDGNCISCDQCKNDCNINGECDEQGCKNINYAPPYCKACNQGFYGRKCSYSCGHCANNATCDNVTGSCPSQFCNPGWKHTVEGRCDQECDDGEFGYYCSKKCSGRCTGGLPCNKVDGVCPGGCANGWISPYCNETCRFGRYGKDCNEDCGHCERKRSCHHTNGSCPGMCEPGYQGEKCLTKCRSGRYGSNCKEECGHCESEKKCNHISGSCPGSCEQGYHGEKCLTTCRPGRYGKDCNEDCGHCEREQPCHHTNGSCPGLCKPGYQGEKCLTTCNRGWYGTECKERCGYCKGNKPCHHVTGSCFGLCEPGYYGQKCEDVFSQILSNQREMLSFMRKFISYKRHKAHMKENGTSPTDFR